MGWSSRKPFGETKSWLPQFSVGSRQQAFLGAALGGLAAAGVVAATGGLAAPAAPAIIAAGLSTGTALGAASGEQSAAIDAERAAAKEAEKLRFESLLKEFRVRQQAEQTQRAAASKGSAGGSNTSTVGMIGQGITPPASNGGIIGTF